MGVENADFSGWATKANIMCSDGRTIMPDAFKHQDKITVPLVWAHTHDEPTNVLGHALLENRPEGVYCYGFFNETEKGKSSKILVQHGDINSLSIFANKLVEQSKKVLHGMIREVSLVLAGANEGAKIENVSIAHSNGTYTPVDDEAVIYSGITFEHSGLDSNDENQKKEENVGDVEHAEKDGGDETVKDIFDTLSEKQQNVVLYLIGQAAGADTGGEAAQSDDEDGLSHLDVQEVFASFDEKQNVVVRHMLTQALQYSDESDEDGDANTDADNDSENEAAHADKEGNTMKHNVFENGASATGSTQGATLTHDDVRAIFELAEEKGSLRKAAVQYATKELKHGIDNIDVLFPDARAVTNSPDFIKRRTEWVNTVLTGTKHVPWSRIKSMTADLTYEAARAKGYVKGSLKKEEFFAVAKRETTPQTIYKKQALDRDDVLDITDFDVVVWMKAEMRLMLDEEIARAILVGDGRSNGHEDKIKELNVRPIVTDDDLYVTRLYVNLGDANSSPQEAIDSIVLNRRHYRGSGTPDFFTSETFLAQMLLIKDTTGRRIYNDVNDVAAALRVRSIITCEILDEPSNNVVGIMVNLQDYTVGADKGGDVTLFEDFDIDYNKQKYLIETRISGALTKPKSALVILKTASAATLVVPTAPTYNTGTHVITIPTVTGVVYKNADSGATLTAGAQAALTEGQVYTVLAVPADSTKYFDTDTQDEFVFTYADGLVSTN